MLVRNAYSRCSWFAILSTIYLLKPPIKPLQSKGCRYFIQEFHNFRHVRDMWLYTQPFVWFLELYKTGLNSIHLSSYQEAFPSTICFHQIPSTRSQTSEKMCTIYETEHACAHIMRIIEPCVVSGGDPSKCKHHHTQRAKSKDICPSCKEPEKSWFYFK